MRATARTDRALGAGLNRLRVVGAALIVDTRVLVARRANPPRGWEFPGGKVEPGESDAAALERELREELDVAVRVTRHLGNVTDDRIELFLWQAELVSGSAIAGSDHDELRWLRADELAAMEWLPLDRQLLRFVRPLLRATSA